MSVIAQSLAFAPSASGRFWRRLALAAVAVGLVAGATFLLAWALAPAAPAAPARNPFGGGVREAAPAAGGLGGYILAVQGNFYRSLQAAVLALKESDGALWPLVALGLAYGVFHAAGPGHGKAIIAAYLVANERALVKGLALSLAAALVQAIVAILVVGVMALVLHATAGAIGRVTTGVELVSFALVALLGLALTWRKAGRFLATAALARGDSANERDQGCDHVHLPPPDALQRLSRWREIAGVVLAAGIRPCSGAIVVLVFALAQGVFAAGVASTVAMALGTALTTGAIATLAVFGKGLALRLAGGRGAAGALAMSAIELLAAAFVLVLGASLLFGLWTSAGS
jgi:nickel/cobalt transporter (NicO) family protein